MWTHDPLKGYASTAPLYRLCLTDTRCRKKLKVLSGGGGVQRSGGRSHPLTHLEKQYTWFVDVFVCIFPTIETFDTVEHVIVASLNLVHVHESMSKILIFILFLSWSWICAPASNGLNVPYTSESLSCQFISSLNLSTMFLFLSASTSLFPSLSGWKSACMDVQFQETMIYTK